MARSSCMAADIFRALPEQSGDGRFPSGTTGQVKAAQRRSRKMAKADKGHEERPLDVLVAGAGYVGLADRGFDLKQARPSLAVAVVDAAPAGVWEKDTRASAIAAAACRMLDRLGCWDEIAPQAQAITEMIVTDSRTVRPGAAGVPDLRRRGRAGRAVRPHGRQQGAERRAAPARRRARHRHHRRRRGVGLRGRAGRHARCISPTASSIETRLLVAADGVNSKLRDMAGIKTVTWEYGQSGIVCTVAHERPHNGRAEEHFLPAGPFAILPLNRQTATARRSSGPSAPTTPNSWSPATSWCSRSSSSSVSA